mgnify:CR=1 FL=1
MTRHRLLIVDDSPIVCKMLRSTLGARSAFEVVGTVGSGAAAVSATARLRPDVVLMDACMPGMDGLEATRAIQARTPTQVILMTGKDGADLRRFSILGTAAGATKVLPKGSLRDPCFADAIEALVKRTHGRTSSARRPAPTRPQPRRAAPASGPPSVIGIVSSTGGPQTLLRVLRPLPASFPAALVLVQHMADGFEHAFLDMLRTHLRIQVALANSGERLKPGRLLVAPPGAHLATRGSFVHLDRTLPAEQGHRPSGNVLLNSLARSHGRRAWGIVLTGMGEDGAKGLLAMKRAGAHTIAQDGASAILDGMPRRARELGAAGVVLADSEMGAHLVRGVKKAA